MRRENKRIEEREREREIESLGEGMEMYHDTPHVILYSVLRALKKGGREMEDESETLEKGAVSEGERMREGHREGTREKKRGTQR